MNIIVITITLIVLAGCNSWHRNAKVNDIQGLSIEKISKCNEFDEVIFQITNPEHIQIVQDLILNATQVNRTCWLDHLKIYGQKKKLTLCFGCDQDACYGKDFESSELRAFLLKHGYIKEGKIGTMPNGPIPKQQGKRPNGLLRK